MPAKSSIGNSSQRESTDSSPVTGEVTPNSGNDPGATSYEGFIPRHSTFPALFQKPVSQEAGAAGQQRSMTNVFQSLSSWTEKKDKQWKEDLVCHITVVVLALAIVDVPVFRTNVLFCVLFWVCIGTMGIVYYKSRKREL